MKRLIFLLFLPMTAYAADWVLVAASQDMELEIDSQSVRNAKGAWFKYIRTPPMNTGCEGPGKKVAYSKDYVEAKCNEFTIRTKQSIAYSEDGSVLEQCSFSRPEANFAEYAPETLGEVYFKTICDPKSRVKSVPATYIRTGKLIQTQTDATLRKLEAQKASMLEQIKQQSVNRTNIDDGKKSVGAQCSLSSECSGVLVCAKDYDSTMKCISSENMMRALNSTGPK